MTDRGEPADWRERLLHAVGQVDARQVHGRVRSVIGSSLRAVAPHAKVGELCELRTPGVSQPLLAEVIGFQDGDAIITPLGEMRGVSTQSLVVPTGRGHVVAVGDALRGRVLDGLGRPLDGSPPDASDLVLWPVDQFAPDPLTRPVVRDVLPTGIRAIDALLTCARGQRCGIFAAAGVGKSSLLGMLANSADADVVVIGLIGERGREVREFIEHDLGPEGLERSVVVCATSDRPAMERAKAAQVATAVAEYFRSQGQRVLLLMDSVTRYARALREIWLAAGEPPARRGYPPSVFAQLPRLLERAGTNEAGSITAFYTVLVEGDDMNEPVADEVRSILDGHIILSRKLAAGNHYPAIDVLASVSRVMNQVVAAEHTEAAGQLRTLMSKYDEIEMLLRVGEYSAGSDELADTAIDRIESIRQFLRQDKDERTSLDETLDALMELGR